MAHMKLRRQRILKQFFLLSTLCCVLVTFIPNTGFATQQPVQVRRFALLVGTNDGGTTRMNLRYANKDAAAVLKVLKDLGGVYSKDAILLKQASSQSLNAAFAKIQKRLKREKKPGVRQEIVFYYSGHSNESGLMLSGDHLGYNTLRKMIKGLSADVKIVIVDSCASGALTRKKGGKKRAPFVVDSSTDVKGVAILTSAAEEESAQESDVVEGSFFTHFFISGLRGAADTTRDKKVTLNEAYVYAFHETLARTETTQSGAQHANYDFQLTGSGDIVLTDLRDTSASIHFSSKMEGRIFIRGKDGQLVAEISKSAGFPIVYGLEPGKYDLILETNKKLYSRSIRVSKGKGIQISPSSFKRLTAEQASRKHIDLKDIEKLTHRPVSMGIFPGVSTDGGAEGRVLNNFSFNLMGWGDHLKGAEIGSIGNGRRGNMYGSQIGGVVNIVNGEAKGFQLGGVANVVRKSQEGFQLTGVANVAGGDVVGLQLGGVSSVAGGEVLGAQIGGVSSVARGKVRFFQLGGVSNFTGGYVRGAQISGVSNFVRGSVRGLQIGGVSNFLKDDMYGLQIGGVSNIVNGDMVGLQIGGIVNAATDNVKGSQLGLVNGGSDVVGLQIGLVNYGTKVRGGQIGLINIAAKEMKGGSLGLVNYAGDGILAPTIWMSSSSMFNLGLKMGSKYFYTILGGGFHPVGDEKRRSVIAGMGGHIEMTKRVWLEIDALHHFLHANDTSWRNYQVDLLEQLRINVGFQLGAGFAVYGGPALNIMISKVREEIGFGANFRQYTLDDSTRVVLSPGLTLGLQGQPRLSK